MAELPDMDSLRRQLAQLNQQLQAMQLQQQQYQNPPQPAPNALPSQQHGRAPLQRRTLRSITELNANSGASGQTQQSQPLPQPMTTQTAPTTTPMPGFPALASVAVLGGSYARAAVEPAPRTIPAVTGGGHIRGMADWETQQTAQILRDQANARRRKHENQRWYLRCVRCIWSHLVCNHETPCGNCQYEITIHDLTGQDEKDMCTDVPCKNWLSEPCPIADGKCHYLHKWQLEMLYTMGIIPQFLRFPGKGTDEVSIPSERLRDGFTVPLDFEIRLSNPWDLDRWLREDEETYRLEKQRKYGKKSGKWPEGYNKRRLPGVQRMIDEMAAQREREAAAAVETRGKESQGGKKREENAAMVTAVPPQSEPPVEPSSKPSVQKMTPTLEFLLEWETAFGYDNVRYAMKRLKIADNWADEEELPRQKMRNIADFLNMCREPLPGKACPELPKV